MNLKTNFNIKNFNTFQLDCVVSHFAELNQVFELDALFKYAQENQLPIRFLGGGSNLILPNKMNALVIKNNLLGIDILEENDDFVILKCASGENWHSMVMSCLQKGYFGLENLALIPGTVGGAPIQNIGAYGVEVNRFITRVTGYDFHTQSFRELTNQDCQFDYRHSIFKTPEYKNFLITDVEFQLPKKHSPNVSYAELAQFFMGQSPSPISVANKVIEVRQKKLPDVMQIPNVGSFFKNPIVNLETWKSIKTKNPDVVSYPQPNGLYKLAAGQLIDKLGFKGKAESSVGMYEKQALVMVNLGQGRIEDVQSLIKKIVAACFKEFGVSLEIEPIFW